MTDLKKVQRVELTWRDGAYYVNKPNIDKAEFVYAEDYGILLQKYNDNQVALQAATEIVKMLS